MAAAVAAQARGMDSGTCHALFPKVSADRLQRHVHRPLTLSGRPDTKTLILSRAAEANHPAPELALLLHELIHF